MQVDLTIVIPTLNERGNIAPLINALARNLALVEWEAVFVDDNSRDGTTEVVLELGRQDKRIKLLQRRNQRGLASACIAGMSAATGRYIVVMDADGQHDSSILPLMLRRFASEEVAMIIASRHLPGACMEKFHPLRKFISAVGIRLCRCVSFTHVTDPLSGFFMIKNVVFCEIHHFLTGRGFKILPDILRNLPASCSVAEVPFSFGSRLHGKSKVGPLLTLQSAYHLVSLAVVRSLYR